MVQGKTKGLQQKATSSRKGNQASQMKKGKRVIPPKKAAAVKHEAMRQVCLFFIFYTIIRTQPNFPAIKSLSAKINRSIERQVVSAASSGKLTIMKNEANESVRDLFSVSILPSYIHMINIHSNSSSASTKKGKS